MLEVNAVYFILLAEGFGLLLLVLIGWGLIALLRRRRKNRAVKQLAARFKQRAARRGEQTESFLQAVYHLEGEDLVSALDNIYKQETSFSQQLIDSLYRGQSSQIANLDAALDKLIDSYKCLQPRIDETPPEETQAIQELTTLRGENEQLRTELSVVKNRMSDIMSEFANMFGGGKDHELAMEEVKARVAAMNAANEIDVEL